MRQRKREHLLQLETQITNLSEQVWKNHSLTTILMLD
jgi:hypothetical protein